MPRRAAAHLRLVSDALVSRSFDRLPDRDGAARLLRDVNMRAPADGPAAPGRRPLWLYGAGNPAKRARARFAAMGQGVTGVIDPDAARWANDAAWVGLPVLTPGAVPQQTRAQALVAVAVLAAPYVPIEDELHRLGWTRCAPLHDVAEAFRDGEPRGFPARLDAAALDEAEAVLAGFEDAASRAHYLRLAAWWLARQEWDFADAPVEPATRFTIPEITRALRPGARVIDAGAGRGAIIAALLRTVGGASAIWAVEPDPARRALLRSYVAGLDLDLRARVQILDAVLGARTGPVRFGAGPEAAARVATPLDALGLDPSLVVLHLAGAERDALAGARQTLLRHRPVIAAALHHDAAGLIATPAWLMRELPDYAVLMRTHGWCGTGAVLYAIPKERAAP